ncbi:cobalamin-binding protein [candidate division KSB3 bacterium]|uniref:Cobalamin-binding protein n=1 Tax=candidate division KSB3 bacterium TaxID=2044937 RepID=A0A9D5Q860_9BACT|nr:cobalamin-binding protein [candidate division KSB3 bacterium]MBD3327645.1 cobalamin-binding protein [candidate division KSB3 bacterium]
MSLEQLCQFVESGKKSEGEALAHELVAQGVDPLEAIDALTEAMGRVGDRFSRLEIFLPEMMLSGEAMASVVEIFRAKMLEGGTEHVAKGKIVLGTVKGDLHEIGKNIVKLMLEAYGFEVKDLGYDVDSFTFLKEAEALKADVIGASALMSTTMPHQKEIIDLLKDRGLRDKYRVIIGGAPTTPQWANDIGADLYCPDAGSAPRLIAELLERRD